MPKKTIEEMPSILKRILAFVIDLLIVNLVLLYPFKGVLESLMPKRGFIESFEYVTTHPEVAAGLELVTFMATIIIVLYFVISEYKLGQTLGKMLMGMRVVSLTKKLGFWQCVLRAFFVIPFFPFYILWLLDPVFALFNKKQQRFMEWVSKTRTVQSYDLKRWNK